MSKNGKMALPQLRFQQFKDLPAWSIKAFRSLAIPVNDRAGTKKYILMSVTSGVGLIPQIEKFGREIAGNAYSNYYVIKKNDFAYNKSATKQFPEGYISILTEYEEAALPNSIFTCFRIVDEGCVPQYFNHLFHNNYHGTWLRRYIEVGARAHGSLSVDTNHLWNMPIALPQIEEQQKIADCLSSIDDLIVAEDKKLEALKTHKKGLLQKLFPAEGSATPAIRLKGFVNPWAQCKLGDVADISSGGTPNRNVASYWGGDIPWATTSEVNYALIKKTTEQITYDGMNNSSAKLLPVGTILMAMYGQGKTRGQVAMLGIEATTNQANANIVTHPDVHNYFIYYQLVKGYENIRSFANEGGQANLSLGIVKKLPIAVVNDIDEQIAIGNLFRSLDELIAAQSNKIETLRLQKKGLMQGLFPTIDEVSE